MIEFLYDISLILNEIWSFELIVGRNFFHLQISCLWWKENLLNHQKVSKYYEHGCLHNFLLAFMSLLTGLIVKNSHILAVIYFIFLKNVLGQAWKASNTKFGPQWKDRESSYQVTQVLVLFHNLVALILDWNSSKGLRVTKFVKKNKFEGVWGDLKAKKLFAETTIHKTFETNSSFHVKQRATGKV